MNAQSINLNWGETNVDQITKGQLMYLQENDINYDKSYSELSKYQASVKIAKLKRKKEGK